MRRPLNSFSEFAVEVPLSRELPYWDFEEDLVVLADGTLVLGLELRGVAVEAWDEARINEATLGFRAFLNGLPDTCELTFVCDVHSDVHELLSEHEALKGEVRHVAWVADARLEALRETARADLILKRRLYACVYRRYKARHEFGGSSWLSRFFAAPRRFVDMTREEHEAAERELRQVAESISLSLSANGLVAAPMSGETIRNVLYRFFNPYRSRSIPAPRLTKAHREQEFEPEELAHVPDLALPSPREQLVFADLIQEYETFFVDGFYHRSITVRALPEVTHASMVSHLMELPFPHSLHVHIRVPEQSKELATLQAKRRVAHSMSISHGGRASDLESEARLQSTEELLRELIGTGQKIFYAQIALLVRARERDELDSRTRAVLSTIRELNGAEGLAETVAGFKVWKSLLPFGSVASVRAKRIKSDNLADFLPLYEPYDGTQNGGTKPVCLFRNRFNGLVTFDPFDARLPNYNSLVTGSSGAGKSFLNNLVLLQYVTQRPLTYVIDIGGSYRKLCEFLGGQYIEIRPPERNERPCTINPFELPQGEAEPSPRKTKFLLAFLENVFTDSDGDKLPKLDKSLLEEAIIQTYARAREVGHGSPTLSSFDARLRDSGDNQLRGFSRMLYPWTGDRAYGRLLDAPNQLSLDADFVVFDLKGLSSYPDLQSVMILIITDFILGRVEAQAPSSPNRRKQILMDECWELLKSRASSHFMEYCVRTLRKTGSGITFITQGLDEIVSSAIGGAILSNTATKFILMQRGDLEPIRRILKLNEQEMKLIASLRQVKGRYSEAFLMANEARTVIQMHPTPLEYWLATSDAADNAVLDAARANDPGKSLSEHIRDLSQQYPFGTSGGK